MKPYYDHAGITIYHGDCREILPMLPLIDAVISDPPYGIGWVPRVNNRQPMYGDDVPFDPRFLLEYGRFHLLFGAQHFADKLPAQPGWFVWVKQPLGFDDGKKTFGQCELAWSDFGGTTRVKHHTWDGNFRVGMDARTSFHPAQKPTEVMLWVISATESRVIIDPFMGSGTTLVAAKRLGRKTIGIEIEERYCEIAAKRLAQEVLPLEPV